MSATTCMVFLLIQISCDAASASRSSRVRNERYRHRPSVGSHRLHTTSSQNIRSSSGRTACHAYQTCQMGRRSGFDIWSALGAVSDETAPQAIRQTPSQLGSDRRSPRKSTAKIATKTTLTCRSAQRVRHHRVSTPGNSRSTTRRLPGPIEQGKLQLRPDTVPGDCQFPVT